MKYFFGAALISLMTFSPVHANDRLPDCKDQDVINASIEAVEDLYTMSGMTGREVLLTKALRGLQDYDTQEAKRSVRVMAKSLRYDQENIKVCAAHLSEDSRIGVWILADPDDLDRWGLLIQNLGLGNSKAAYGWLTED